MKTSDIFIDIIKKNSDKYLTAREVAEQIKIIYPEEFADKLSRTSKNNDIELIRQYAAELARQYPSLKEIGISRTADKPQRYFINSEHHIEISKEQLLINDEEQIKERVLYPVLRDYCKMMGIYTLRIEESATDGKKELNKNMWLHPDVVGFKDTSRNYTDEAKKCMIEYGCERSSLYSFEVKRGDLNTGNLRKNFFQAVSNSSWANYSYLVAEGVEENTLEELQLLCSSFKIGFIQLKADDYEQSEIKIYAPKTELDWNMMNRICVNKDFKQYLENITLAYKRHSNQDIKPPKWD